MKKLLIASVAGLGLSLVAASAYAGPGHHRGDRMWDKLDANGDGKITAEEMSEANADLLAKADANGDGAITKEEMKAFHEARRDEWRKEHNPDANGDGVVDRTEFINAAQKRFDDMDKNGDGVISEDEQPHHRGRHHRRGDDD